MRRASVRLLLPVLLFLAIDQISKFAVRRWLDPHELITLLPFFRLEHVENRGIAFGMYDQYGAVIVLVSAAVVTGIVLAAILSRHDSRLVLPLAMLVAGSIGNLTDRLGNSSVTDFFHFEYWPAFNFADAFIVVGVLLLGVEFLWPRHKEPVDPGGHLT